MKKIITFSLLILFAACKTATPTIGGEATFDILKQETNGGRAKAGNVVITSQKELDALYSELNLTTAPVLDFTTNNVVAVFMGQKNTGGYSIRINKVVLNDNAAIVTIQQTRPEDMAAMMITEPYCIAKIPKTKKVEFLQQ